MGLFGLFNKKKKEALSNKREPETRLLGFVLLSDNSWSKEQFFEDFKKEWGIELTEGADAAEEEKDKESNMQTFAAFHDGMMLFGGLVDAPVPEGEAERFAQANYLWKSAVEETKKHTAHIMLGIMGEGPILKKADLFIKAASTALKQNCVIGFYNNGVVYQPEMYCDCANSIKENVIPILNLLWFGIYSDEKKAGIYTYGMRQYGWEELEVYVPRDKVDLNEIRDFVVDVVAFVLQHNEVLKDGETIGFTAEQKLPISIGKAIALDGNSVKIDLQK